MLQSAEYLTVAEKETGCPYVVCLPNCSTDPVLSLGKKLSTECLSTVAFNYAFL